MRDLSHRGTGAAARFSLATVILAFGLSGCVLPAIEGVAYNHRGEELPGVAVVVEGTGRQEVTDARGRYRIGYRPGDVVLRFTKSGFTPGRLEFALPEAREVRAIDMTLWQLPVGEGAHILRDDRYIEIMALEPEPYLRIDGEPVYGTTKWTTTKTPDTRPLILCHKMPRYNLELCSLSFIEARTPNDPDGRVTTEIWAKNKTIPIDLVPVDQPEEMLLHLDYEGALEPGTYAIHWGALDGLDEADPRAFFFAIAGDLLPPGGDEKQKRTAVPGGEPDE